MRDRPSASGGDRLSRRMGGVSVSAVDHHAGAVLREQPRDSRADTQ